MQRRIFASSLHTTSEAEGAGRRQAGAHSSLIKGIVLAMLLLLLLFSGMVSIAFGAADINIATVYRSLIAFDGSPEHTIIHTLRVPRALIATLVGAALAVAGALMQALTRNPLASPGILGINAGAALAVVAGVFLLKVGSLTLYAWFAFAGAVIAAAVVYLLSSLGPGGSTPLALALAGAAVTSFCSSLLTGILILNERTFDEVRFWLAGSVAGREMHLFFQALPYLASGLILALLLSRQITTLSLGDEVARGLGQRTGWIKLAAATAVVLLAGGAVAATGPIGFIGLVIPHVVRLLVGGDYRWVIPYCAVVGAIFLLLADILARVLISPQEVPVGVVTAVVGGPFFIALVRRKVRR